MDPFTAIAAIVITSAMGLASTMSVQQARQIRANHTPVHRKDQDELAAVELGIRLLEMQQNEFDLDQIDQLDALELRRDQLKARELYGVVAPPPNPEDEAMLAALTFLVQAEETGIETSAPRAFGSELEHVSVPVHSMDWSQTRLEHDALFDTIRRRYNAVPFLVVSRKGSTAVTFTVNPRELTNLVKEKGLRLFLLGRSK